MAQRAKGEEEGAREGGAAATAAAATEAAAAAAAGAGAGAEVGPPSPHPPSELPTWMVEAQKHDTVQTWFHALVSRHFAGSLKPPFNEEARALAGFDESWYRPLALDDEKRRREQAERGRSEAAAAVAAAAEKVGEGVASLTV